MVAVSYPGIYTVERSSGVRAIAQAPTAIAAFVGAGRAGPEGRGTRVLSFTEFERRFGGLVSDSEMSYGVSHFFANGGGEAVILRVSRRNATAAAITLLDDAGNPALVLRAASTGRWGNGLVVEVDTAGIATDTGFNLRIADTATETVEEFRNLSTRPADPRFAPVLLNDSDTGSRLVDAARPAGAPAPPAPLPRPARTGTYSGAIAFGPGSLAPLDATLNLTLRLDIAGAAARSLPVSVLRPGDEIPASLAELARVIERAANAALSDRTNGIPRGAAVRVEPVALGGAAGGNALRVSAAFDQSRLPGTRDAIVTLLPGLVDAANDQADLLARLGLAFTPNVSVAQLGQAGRGEEVMLTDTGGAPVLALRPVASGATSRELQVEVDWSGAASPQAFALRVTAPGEAPESFDNLSLAAGADNAATRLDASGLLRARVPEGAAGRPAPSGTVTAPHAYAAPGAPAGRDYSLRVTINRTGGAIEGAQVVVLDNGAAYPADGAALAQHLETRINNAVAAILPGAAVEVDEVTIDGAQRILRFRADFDPNLVSDAADATVVVEPAANATDDALAELGLAIASTAPRHIALGLPPSGATAGAVAGTDGDAPPDLGALLGGLRALAEPEAPFFTLLSIPDVTRPQPGNPMASDLPADQQQLIWDEALQLCTRRRAFLLVDPPPEANDVDRAADWRAGLVAGSHGAAYFPRLRAPDPLDDFRPRSFAPSGALCGLFARTDSQRGVWKAPAGTEAVLSGVTSPTILLDDPRHGLLNPIGLNVIRSFPVHGNVCFGARTLEGADIQASEWKYVPVRRTASFITESLVRGLRWVIFEPNDEPLWAQIRLNVGAFMQGLFRQGAFAGRSAREAYRVKCDRETTTPEDVRLGIVNIVVGFAPLHPAEFVVLTITQLAGQDQG